MKKRNLLTISLIIILVLAINLGTVAYFSKAFISNDNIVRAARFEVDSNGTLDENVEFDLTEEPIYPGFADEVYEFEIDKKGTEVPVKYEIQLTTKDSLFEAKGVDKPSPVALGLYRKVNDEWKYIGSTNKIELIPENTVENFKIMAEWKHSSYDNDYQNATGKVDISVVATQIDGKPGEPGEEEPPTGPTIVATYYKKNPPGYEWGTFVTIKVENVENAAKFRIKYTNAKGSRVTTNTYVLGDDKTTIQLTGDRIDPTNLDVLIYDQRGPNDNFGSYDPLHTFTNVNPTLVTP